MREISSHTNEYIKELKSLKQKKFRDEHGKYIIEGRKVIEEAFEYGQEIEALLVSEHKSDLVEMAEQRGVQVITVPHEIIQQIADAKSPPREIACLKKAQRKPGGDGRFFVGMDDINDPKNLGTIIRTADAVGADGVFISQSSADYYGPKAQRAAMGSTFHLDVEVCDLVERLAQFKKEGGVVVSGHLHGQEELSAAYDSVCLVIGNEARGISADVKELSDELYKIKLYGRAESLNASVAAGIMLYDIRKRLKG